MATVIIHPCGSGTAFQSGHNLASPTRAEAGPHAPVTVPAGGPAQEPAQDAEAAESFTRHDTVSPAEGRQRPGSAPAGRASRS